MNTKSTTVLRRSLPAASAAAILLLAAAGASARDAARETLTLAPPAPGDLAAAALAAPAEVPEALMPDVPRDPVSFTFPLDPSQPLAARPAPPRAESREYWQQVEAGELGRGVPLYATAPGALVRISPVAVRGELRAPAIDPAGLALIPPSGEALAPGEGMSLLAGAEALRAAGMAFPEGTAAFRIDRALGAGRFELRAPALAETGRRYLVHVLDAGSDLALAIEAGDTAILAGGELTVDAGLTAGEAPVAAGELEGFVSSPDGRLRPVTFERGRDGLWRAAFTVAGATAAPGLWEVHARAAGEHRGLTAVRSVRVPFAVAAPSARLTGAATVIRPAAAKGAGALRIELPVEASAAGRYEARGVVWGTAADGTLRPLAAVHAADWIEPGTAVLALEVPADILGAAGLGAPWELRDLRLHDQGRMGLLHRQAEALAVR